jgi:preprotein translocase subunit Sec61beta
MTRYPFGNPWRVLAVGLLVAVVLVAVDWLL